MHSWWRGASAETLKRQIGLSYRLALHVSQFPVQCFGPLTCGHSQPRRIINESPRHFEPPRDFRREGLHAEGFRGIMAAVEHVDAKFFGLCKSPMRPFAGSEGIHAFLRGDFQIAARAAGDHADALAGDWPARNDFNASADRLRQSLRQFGPRDLGFELEPDKLVFVAKE